MEARQLPLTLLVNPTSAGGRALKLLPRVEAALDARRGRDARQQLRWQRRVRNPPGVRVRAGASRAGVDLDRVAARQQRRVGEVGPHPLGRGGDADGLLDHSLSTASLSRRSCADHMRSMNPAASARPSGRSA